MVHYDCLLITQVAEVCAVDVRAQPLAEQPSPLPTHQKRHYNPAPRFVTAYLLHAAEARAEARFYLFGVFFHQISKKEKKKRCSKAQRPDKVP